MGCATRLFPHKLDGVGQVEESLNAL